MLFFFALFAPSSAVQTEESNGAGGSYGWGKEGGGDSDNSPNGYESGGYQRGEGGFRGRGGGRGRGGRGGGRGGGFGDRGDRGGFGDRGGDRVDYGEHCDRGDRPPRGGRGDGGEDGNAADGDFNDEKPREFYIPTEMDESDIFGSGISSGINFSKYDNIPVKVTGENLPESIIRFEDSGLSKFLLENVTKSGYTQPTPIQKASIPVVMSGRDLMGCSQTGSGKTAAFLLPILHDLLTDSRDLNIGKPQAVIVAPTRELAIQIYNEARKFAMGSYIKLCLCYGGTSTRHQSSNVGKGCHVLVATPGRLLDFVDRTYITFDDVRYMVLDEADRMLDMGFLPAIDKIMNHSTMVAQTERHTLMFSATFPDEIQLLAGRFLQKNYVFVSVGMVGGACSDVTQSVYEVNKFNKRDKLLELLNAEDPVGTIVFVETKRMADFLASFFSETGHPTTSIHGDRLQRQREEALADFKAGRMKVLIATSVAARGLDIKNVQHVINYDMPKDIDEYVHRIGRTGRVGNKGRASSFYDPEGDSAIAESLRRILSDTAHEVPDFLGAGHCGGGGGGRAFGGKDSRSFQQQEQEQGGEEEAAEGW